VSSVARARRRLAALAPRLASLVPRLVVLSRKLGELRRACPPFSRVPAVLSRKLGELRRTITELRRARPPSVHAAVATITELRPSTPLSFPRGEPPRLPSSTPAILCFLSYALLSIRN
jgi:hypothetical protein